MDPRHQTLDQQTLNQIITAINQYMENNTDYLCDLRNKKIRNYIHTICRSIYKYAGLKVDVKSRLAKKNLLSIDVVFFPEVKSTSAEILRYGNEFQKLRDQIAMTVAEAKFKKRINTELNKIINKSLKVQGEQNK